MPLPRNPAALPIGVFDSGVGGLTVLRALREALPEESFVYLGDTARLPYGTKTPGTVAAYAQQAAHILVERGVKMLVIACNTASAVAIDSLRERFRPLPVLGVVEPGAQAAVTASATGCIVVTGTEGTIRGRAYERAILRIRPDAVVTGIACPLFVALAEEGWVEGPIPEAIASRYLETALGQARRVDCIVLGCTHFPVLTSALAPVVGARVTVVDSAATTAAAVKRELHSQHLEAPATAQPYVILLATDGVARFSRVGSRFLGVELAPDTVELVDL